MLVLENTIFTFNQFPANNVDNYEGDIFDPTLMDDCTQGTYSFAPEKIDYDDYCPSPGIIDTTSIDNNEGNSPVRRHRFSICKANDPQAIIAYRRLSNACSSIIPSPNQVNSSLPTPLLFDERKTPCINEQENGTLSSPTLENSLFLNASTSCPNIMSEVISESSSPRAKLTPIDSHPREGLSPFATILTPNTFKPILTPDQIIDNVDHNTRDLDDQFRLFNYVEEDEDEEDEDSLPSALNSNSQLNEFNEDYNISSFNPDLRLNSNNNIRNSEVVTSNQNILVDEDDQENYYTSLDKVCQRAQLESKVIESIEKEKREKKIKTYSQNVQGLYGLWKDNLGIGFKSILRE